MIQKLVNQRAAQIHKAIQEKGRTLDVFYMMDAFKSIEAEGDTAEKCHRDFPDKFIGRYNSDASLLAITEDFEFVNAMV